MYFDYVMTERERNIQASLAVLTDEEKAALKTVRGVGGRPVRCRVVQTPMAVCRWRAGGVPVARRAQVLVREGVGHRTLARIPSSLVISPSYPLVPHLAPLPGHGGGRRCVGR